MTIRHALAILACCTPFASPVLANPLVALDSAVFVERGAPQSGRMLEPAARLSRGDRVVYVVSWTRMGGQGGFVVTNPLPRSVAFQATALVGHLEQLPTDPLRTAPTPEQDLAGDLLAALHVADATDLCRRDRHGRRTGLAELLMRVAADLPELTTRLTRAYFSHADAAHAVSAAGIPPR